MIFSRRKVLGQATTRETVITHGPDDVGRAMVVSTMAMAQRGLSGHTGAVRWEPDYPEGYYQTMQQFRGFNAGRPVAAVRVTTAPVGSLPDTVSPNAFPSAMQALLAPTP